MKKSKRYIKKLNKTPLINKRVMNYIINNSNICKHAIRELKLTGYGNGKDGPLRFTNDEWQQISADGTCQNIRKDDVFKEPNGDISYNGAFTKKPIEHYSFATKEWTKNKNIICWSGGLFEHENNILTGRYFSRCNLWAHDTIKGWMPKEKEVIECLEVEIAPDNWIMAVNANNTNLLFLSVNYNIQWKECPCIKGVRLEDVTPELEEKALNEIKNNN